MSLTESISALPRRAQRSLSARATRRVRQLVRALLLRAARARPSREALAGADRRVVILLASAWGMGGTIRAALNLGGYLDADHDVEVLSAHRRRQAPFMGEFPPGLAVTALDDQRDGVQTGLGARIAAWLRRYPSVLVDPADEAGYPGFTIYSDTQLGGGLGGGAGVVIAPGRGLTLLLAARRRPG